MLRGSRKARCSCWHTLHRLPPHPHPTAPLPTPPLALQPRQLDVLQEQAQRGKLQPGWPIYRESDRLYCYLSGGCWDPEHSAHVAWGCPRCQLLGFPLPLNCQAVKPPWPSFTC